MCCFFRTAVTSFPVKSHSLNSHFMCRGAGPEQVRPLVPNQKPYQFQRNMWSPDESARALVRFGGYSVYYCSSDVCWHEASYVSSVVLFVKLQNGCFKVGCAAAGRWAVIFRPRYTSTCWTLVVFDHSQVSPPFFFFFLSVIFCRKV